MNSSESCQMIGEDCNLEDSPITMPPLTSLNATGRMLQECNKKGEIFPLLDSDYGNEESKLCQSNSLPLYQPSFTQNQGNTIIPESKASLKHANHNHNYYSDDNNDNNEETNSEESEIAVPNFDLKRKERALNTNQKSSQKQNLDNMIKKRDFCSKNFGIFLASRGFKQLKEWYSNTEGIPFPSAILFFSQLDRIENSLLEQFLDNNDLVLQKQIRKSTQDEEQRKELESKIENIREVNSSKDLNRLSTYFPQPGGEQFYALLLAMARDKNDLIESISSPENFDYYVFCIKEELEDRLNKEFQKTYSSEQQQDYYNNELKSLNEENPQILPQTISFK